VVVVQLAIRPAVLASEESIQLGGHAKLAGSSLIIYGMVNFGHYAQDDACLSYLQEGSNCIKRLEISVGREAVEMLPFAVTSSQGILESTRHAKEQRNVSIQTLRNCMSDGYADFPFYEQLQYEPPLKYCPSKRGTAS
jgi:hypothetical protein